MNEEKIRSLVKQLGVKDNTHEEFAWLELKPLGVSLMPYFLECFPQAKKLQARRSILFHAIRFARINDEAFQLGLLGLNDRSSIVRYRACCVLAYSLRRDAIPFLEKLLNHLDLKTVADAKAAIDAISNQNHHYFLDRNHTGGIFWQVNDGDTPKLY
jgi:hypothetical protein